MKTKMFKKLIAVVCAATMATSCAAMSVGAVPKGEATEQVVNWEKVIEDVRELLNFAKTVKNEDCIVVENCQFLADRIRNFMGRYEYDKLTNFIHDVDDKILDEEYGVTKIMLAFMPGIAVTELESDKQQERRFGSSRAIDYFNCIIKIIESGLV